MTLVTRQPAPGAPVGRRRSDDARQRPAHLLPSPPPVPRGDLEVPADLLGGHRLRAARQPLPGRRLGRRRRGLGARRARSTRARTRRALPAGSRRRSCSSWSATAPRWAWRRMHTWLPDAHSEAPSLVSALLSGALLNCAFLGILRVAQVLDAAGRRRLARPAASSSACSRWRSRRLFIVASRTTSGCSPTRASSTWGSSPSAWARRRGRLRRDAPRASTTRSPRRCSSSSREHAGRLPSKRAADVRGALRALPAPAPCGSRASWRSPGRRRSASSSASSRSCAGPSSRRTGVSAVVYLALLAVAFAAMARRGPARWRWAPLRPASRAAREAPLDDLAPGRSWRCSLLAWAFICRRRCASCSHEAARLVGGP